MSSVLHRVWRPRVQRESSSLQGQECLLLCSELCFEVPASLWCWLLRYQTLCAPALPGVWTLSLYLSKERQGVHPGEHFSCEVVWGTMSSQCTNIHSQAVSSRTENVGDISLCCTQIFSLVLLLTSSRQTEWAFISFFFLTNASMENRNFFERLTGWVSWLNKSRPSIFISVIMQELWVLCTNGISVLYLTPMFSQEWSVWHWSCFCTDSLACLQ